MRRSEWLVPVVMLALTAFFIVWVAYEPKYCVNSCVRHGGAYEECERSCHKLLED